MIAILLLAGPPIFFLVQAFRTGPRSRRLANLALFCGLTTFLMPEAVLEWSPAERSRLFPMSATLRLLLGVVGLAFSLAALLLRRDGGTGIARPVIGAAFNLLQLIVGAGLFVFSSFTQSSTQWVYESPDNSYRLTLPSKEWKQAPKTGGVGAVAFIRPFPRMQAAVLSVKQEKSEADFRQAADALRTRADSDPEWRGKANFKDGINGAGNAYRYCTLIDSGPKGEPVFVAQSVIWSPSKRMIVEVLFEGQPGMASRTGKAAEMEAFEKAAEIICLSVE
jgi:hypothetical protein